MIVRRQRTTAGQQLSFDDLDGWRFHAFLTNLPGLFAPANMVEAHHRLRGGIPEDTIRQLKEDLGLIHAPVQNFLWELVVVARHGAPSQHRPAGSDISGCRPRSNSAAGHGSGSRSSTSQARVVNHAGPLELRLPRSHAWADAFIEALTRIRELPAFA